ncbi:MAG TPA: YwiC-like family protein [Chloroflexaceae bacterium]|nr:YwiC-like family protein [Chloroflexaceae bacterium]
MSAPTRSEPVRLRPIALPVEHGGWAFLGAPVLLGMLVAPSVAGAWLGLAALGAFLTRQPLKLAVGDRRRGRRFPRTAVAERFVLLYATAALLAFVVAWMIAAHPFWAPLLLAAPLAAAQLSFDLRKQSRALPAELAGAVAISSLAATIATAGGWAIGPALVLWLLLALQAVAAIVYVGARLRLARGEPARRWPTYATHLAALAVVAGLGWLGAAPWLAAGAFAVLAARAALGLLPAALRAPAPLVGVQEIGFSLLTVAAIAFGFR